MSREVKRRGFAPDDGADVEHAISVLQEVAFGMFPESVDGKVRDVVTAMAL
jgi:hypothetical protein